MFARIYQPARAAMTSGTANLNHWVLEFEAAQAKRRDPLMGWQGSGDTNGQVHISSTPARRLSSMHGGTEFRIRSWSPRNASRTSEIAVTATISPMTGEAPGPTDPLTAP